MESSTITVKKNTLLDTLANSYLSISLNALGEYEVKKVLKGRYPNLNYTTHGYDASNLSYENKAKLVRQLLGLNIAEFGEKKAIEDLENLVSTTRDRLGALNDFTQLIGDLPEGVFEEQRVKILDRDALEEKTLRLLKELKQTKESLNTSVVESTLDMASKKDTLEAILYNTSDGVLALDKNFKIITFNKAMEELTGYHFDEVKGMVGDEVVRLYEGEVQVRCETFCPNISKLVERTVYVNNKLTLLAKNGSKKYVRLVSSLVPDNLNVNLGCIITITDITKEIELETMKLDFVSIAAHELRTPLTSMRGFLALLSEGLEGGSITEEYLEYLQKITVGADQLYTLVENLLNISRIERGNITLERSSVDWLALVKDVILRFEETASNLEITLKLVDSNKPFPYVDVDKTLIAEVLSNLIDNALKNTQKGGRISVMIEETDDFLVTYVKDNGIGIPPQSIPHIFKKFYRVESPLEQAKQGTGLGLYIAKEIVSLHGGTIKVDSKVNEGSTFYFSVPIQSDE